MERVVISQWPAGGEWALSTAYSDVPEGFTGACAVELDGKSTVIFPSNAEASKAACWAINLEVGGYSLAIVMPALAGQRVSHQTAEDWIF